MGGCVPGSVTSTILWPGRPPAGWSTRRSLAGPASSTWKTWPPCKPAAGVEATPGCPVRSADGSSTTSATFAAKAGIAVVTVPARGTSKHCPRCGEGRSVLHHAPAPDRPTERGWKWAICPRCGLSCDRDWAAAERIAARGLLAQAHTRTDRHTGRRAIHTIVEGNVARMRHPKQLTRATKRAHHTGRDTYTRPDRPAKTRPTPTRRTQPTTGTRAGAGTTETFPRMPERRTAPAPTPVGQRPAGQAPQTRRPPATRSGLARDPQRRTGFHHIRATPVIRLPADHGTTRRPGHTVRNV
jgi:hypothetical protein